MLKSSVALPYINLLRISMLGFISVNLYFGIVHYFPSFKYLWVLPLLLYGGSFFMAITKNQLINHNMLLTAKPFFILPLLVPISLLVPPSFFSYALYGIVFFFLVLLCHNEIVTEKKRHRNHMDFFLFMALGAALGGAFAVILLPSLKLFQGAHFAFSMVLLGFFLPQPAVMMLSTERKPDNPLMDMLLPLGLLAVLVVLRLSYPHFAAVEIPVLGKFSTIMTLIYCIVATTMCFTFRNSSLRFGLGGAAILVCALFLTGSTIPYRTGATLLSIELTKELMTLVCAVSLFAFLKSPVLFKQQTPSGLIKVVHNLRNNIIELNNDGTIHGSQSLDPKLHAEPISYYSRKGPLGQLFAAIPAERHIKEIAVIGLGVGTMAAYGKPDQTMTFYEINPIVDALAHNRKYFTYLSKSKATIKTIIGDARHTIEKAAAHRYDMIICDAYLGANIPKHLMTREAIELYSDKLATSGLLVFEITNKTVDLMPILGTLMQSAGFVGVYQKHLPITDAGKTKQKTGLAFARAQSSDKKDQPIISEKWGKIVQALLVASGLTRKEENPDHVSTWVVTSRNQDDLAFLTTDNRWHPLSSPPETVLWTDSLWKYDAIKHIYAQS